MSPDVSLDFTAVLIVGLMLATVLAPVALSTAGSLRQYAPTLLATGMFALATGAAVLIPVTVRAIASPPAGLAGTDLAGIWLLLLGSTLLLISLVGLGFQRRASIMLAALNVPGVLVVTQAIAPLDRTLGSLPVLLYCTGFLLIGAITLAARGQWRMLGQALLLAGCGAAIVWALLAAGSFA